MKNYNEGGSQISNFKFCLISACARSRGAGHGGQRGVTGAGTPAQMFLQGHKSPKHRCWGLGKAVWVWLPCGWAQMIIHFMTMDLDMA